MLLNRFGLYNTQINNLFNWIQANGEKVTGIRRQASTTDVRYAVRGTRKRASWISNGLREFWDKATVLRLAAVAKSKQYCLSDAEARGGASCIACASRKTVAPKLSAALNFLWLLSLFQDKESNIQLGEQKTNK